MGKQYTGPYQCPQCACGSKDLTEDARALLLRQLGRTCMLRCQICLKVFVIQEAKEVK